MDQSELKKCLSGAELGELIDGAFASWQAGIPDPRFRRRTPRLKVSARKPLSIVAYRFEGRDFGVTRQAKLVDVSADGLGILFDRDVPVGAQMCFSFLDDAGECGYGWARVVSRNPHAEGFRIGLEFEEDAHSLDLDETDPDRAVDPAEAKPYWVWAARFRRALRFGWQVVARRDNCRKELTRVADGATVRLVVHVKLTRFNATLFVNERKVVCQSGVLLDRLRSLWTDAAMPTMIHLEGEGFSAWATLRANEVTRCRLDLSASRLQERCQELLFGSSHSIGRDSGQAGDQQHFHSSRANAGASGSWLRDS